MSEQKKKMDIITKMSIAGVAIVVVIVLAIIGVSCSSKSANTNKSTSNTIILKDEKDSEDQENKDREQIIYERATAVVKYVDAENQSLMIYDIENLKKVTLSVDSSVEIKDAYGTDIALAQLKLGDMVEAKYDDSSKKPEYVKVTAKTWERKDVSNMKVDLDNKTITIANETYQFTDELVTSDEGVPFDITTLNEADEAVVRGYMDYVWSIVILNGHGTLTLKNHQAFVGGEIEIDSRLVVQIESDMSIEISAGVKNIVISKDNMAPYVTQVMIEENQEFVIDLSEAQPKIGKVDFILMQDDVEVYLDEELVDLSESKELDFGTYKVRAEKEGFDVWESELEMNQAYMQYKIDLEKKAAKLYIQQPVGAEVYLDKKYIGVIPVEVEYPQGTHELMLRKDGYHTFTQDFYWDNNEQDQYIVMPSLTPLTQVEEKNNENNTDYQNSTNDNNNGVDDNKNDEQPQNPANPSPNSSNQVTN